MVMCKCFKQICTYFVSSYIPFLFLVVASILHAYTRIMCVGKCEWYLAKQSISTEIVKSFRTKGDLEMYFFVILGSCLLSYIIWMYLISAIVVYV